MRIESVSVTELLEDLAFENPPPEELWFQRSAFDPMHGATEIRSAARKGLIELDDSGDKETWRFRLTAKGRAALGGSRS